MNTPGFDSQKAEAHKAKVIAILEAAGFRDIRIEKLSHDIQNFYYIMTKPENETVGIPGTSIFDLTRKRPSR